MQSDLVEFTTFLLFYTKSSKFTWNRPYLPHDPEYVKRAYRHKDERGHWRSGDLTASGLRDGESGEVWRGIDPSNAGRHWSTPTQGGMNAYIRKHNLISGWPDNYPSVHSRLEALDASDLIHWPTRGKMPSLKRYLASTRGNAVDDLFIDIGKLEAASKEKTDYPTQKPLALLERIIKASSNEGDMVFDPFCGCATTCIAAEKLGRLWAGIDISPNAVTQVRNRMVQTNLDVGGRHLSVHTTAPSRSDGTKMPRRQIKHVLYGQQEGDCNGCGEHFAFHMLEVDHVWPRSKGGPDTLENSQLLCRHCNGLKGTGTMDNLAVKLAAWQRKS